MASASNYAKTTCAILYDRLWHVNGNSMDENSHSVQLSIILHMIRRAMQKYVEKSRADRSVEHKELIYV